MPIKSESTSHEDEDQYSVLGVSKNCTIDDIKKSYKKLCLKYHPDVSQENPKKFLELREAYDYLITHHKNISEKSSYERMFNDMFKTMNKSKTPTHAQVVRCSIEEVREGFTRDMTFFVEIPCAKCTPISKSICKLCNGLGFHKELIKDSFHFNKINQQDQSFLYKEFHKGLDLIIKVHIVSPEPFKIKGKNIESFESIDIFKAIVGGPFEVRTIHGTKVVNLPEGNISDFNYVIEENGLFDGCQLIKLKVFLYKNLTIDQKDKLIKILHDV